jgi:bifunctional DNase/RNase
MQVVPAPRHRALVFGLVAVVAVGAAAVVAQKSRPSLRPAAPSHYQPMEVVELVAFGAGGYAVALSDARRAKTVTIYVGESEGRTIALRRAGLQYERPLTADLLDSVMRELGGELEFVQVDALRDNVFYGSVHLRQGQRETALDARASDAIALALGNHVPILVHDSVIAIAGH